ncbi:ABC transporter substrate-binding protein [Oceanicola sp. 502str15]|uniref:ABC transporter substrate-binding protein n=1 Tax=Oceanicola sp. 502str15 TaxID=2696061 RepID=UPI002094D19D|nr:ABC transporter substrate-binding protein [Oceanicola sp. 502str15]MCO6383278.1 ABC transporter substrate-binding protein [Oceanicola sp. 502str15]
MTTLAAADVTARGGLLPVRFILNTFYSGPQAWFFLADDNGYFREEGLEVTFTEGSSLARAVTTMTSGDYDVGYGDLNELVRMQAEGRADTPVAVMAIHNRPPYTIAVDAGGRIKSAADLPGARLVSHPQDAAWLLFPEFCRATGIDPESVEITISEDPHKVMVPQMLAGEWDGIFGFVNTVAAQAIEAGVDPAVSLHHLAWHSEAPAFYGGAMMVTRAFREAHPEAVAGLCRAVNRGLADTVADIDGAIEAVARRNPGIDRAANRARLIGTLALEMGDAAATLGLGDVEDARLREIARLIAQAKGYAHQPAPEEVFDRSFLVPAAERARMPAATPGA